MGGGRVDAVGEHRHALELTLAHPQRPAAVRAARHRTGRSAKGWRCTAAPHSQPVLHPSRTRRLDDASHPAQGLPAGVVSPRRRPPRRRQEGGLRTAGGADRPHVIICSSITHRRRSQCLAAAPRTWPSPCRTPLGAGSWAHTRPGRSAGAQSIDNGFLGFYTHQDKRRRQRVTLLLDHTSSPQRARPAAGAQHGAAHASLATRISKPPTQVCFYSIAATLSPPAPPHPSKIVAPVNLCIVTRLPRLPRPAHQLSPDCWFAGGRSRHRACPPQQRRLTVASMTSALDFFAAREA
jgi:hypothetical protein